MTINLSDEMVNTLKACVRDSILVLRKRIKNAAKRGDAEMVQSGKNALNDAVDALEMLQGMR